MKRPPSDELTDHRLAFWSKGKIIYGNVPFIRRTNDPFNYNLERKQTESAQVRTIVVGRSVQQGAFLLLVFRFLPTCTMFLASTDLSEVVPTTIDLQFNKSCPNLEPQMHCLKGQYKVTDKS